MEWITEPQGWLALLTLTVLEIVLGIDNIVFISILAGKLPEAQQENARRTGLAVALITRILLLGVLFFLVGSEGVEPQPLFHLGPFEPSLRDLIVGGGGLFLIYKATKEIHDKLEGEEHGHEGRAGTTFASVIAQIALLDIVFSVDSVITAIGIAEELSIMIIAIIIAVAIMLFAAGPISRFVQRHPTVKMLALSFLLMIGFTLLVEAFHVEIPKGYIYAAMGFSIFVEMLNLRVRAKGEKSVDLHQQPVITESGKAVETVKS